MLTGKSIFPLFFPHSNCTQISAQVIFQYEQAFMFMDVSKVCTGHINLLFWHRNNLFLTRDVSFTNDYHLSFEFNMLKYDLF